MPLSDASGMTNVDKLMVAGDVSGAALIRLAINEAVRAIDRIQPTGALRGSEGFDVVIVGSGPAGLAAALRCQERQLTYCVLERDRLASTIRSYPKGKHVMAEPSNIELNGALWFQDCSKEELLERWQETARAQRLQIREQTEVRRIERIDGRFVIEAQNGRLVAENVLICIGKRGAPRRLGVPGESHPRVRYLLEDPDDYRGKRVMVVGGGDSALEAALALADVAGTFVTLSYRRAAFARAKVQNRRRLEAQEAAGRIHVELNSTVAAVMPHVVRLTTARGEIDVPNDFVLALLGADPPTEFLQSAGIRVLQPGSQEMMEFAAGRGERQQAVKCDRCAGYAERACLEACPTGALIEVETDRLFLETEADSLTGIRRFSEAPFLFGVPGEQARWKVWVTLITLLSLTAIGIECFLIRTQPEISLLGQYVRVTRAHFDVSYTSGRGIGHWLGYVGAGMMLASFFYSPRTRIRRFQHWGSQTGWFSAHIWLGFAGAMLVTYHSALKLDRWASIACVLMWLTVLTGAVGRYLFGRIRSEAGLAEFELEVLRGRLLAPAQGASDTGAVSAQWAAHRRINYYRVLDMLLRHWKMAHIVLAIAMAILAAIHIVYGFRYKAV
jgi:putative YpdA family bacillithiol system oxidoreductase